MDTRAVVDTHFHVWDLAKFDYQFPTQDHASIYRDVTLQEYSDNLEPTDIKHAIFVQVEPRAAVEETEWLLEQAPRFPFLKGIVAGFNLHDPQLSSILERYADNKLLVGVRNILDYHGDDWILQDEALRGIRLLVDLGIPFSVLCNKKSQWDNVLQLVKMFPQGRFVLDHLGKPVWMDEVRSGWDEWIAQMARYPNLHCKLSSQYFPHSGPLTEAERNGNFTQIQRQYVQRCIEVFGVGRLMFGTDWPVSILHGPTCVEDIYRISRGLLSHLTPQETHRIYGTNSLKFYDIDV